jgi:hypothetical protein
MKFLFDGLSIFVFILAIMLIAILFFTYASIIAIRLSVLAIVAIFLGMVIYGGVLLFKGKS